MTRRMTNKKMRKFNPKITFGKTYSPYFKYGETMQDWFEAYENDSAKNIEVDGKNYYKIIYWCEFYKNDEKSLLVAVVIDKDLKIGDILVDENGNEFVFKDIEMLKYSSEIPKWSRSVLSILLQPLNDSIGEYLCRKE